MYKLYIFFFCLILSSVDVVAHPGTGIVMDSEGTVYYTDLVHVWKITPDGNHTIAVKNVHTHELYLDSDDNLYGEHVWYNGEAADTWGYYVWCLSNTGELDQTVPPTEGFPLNNTLVRDFDGTMYFADKAGDHEVLKKETIDGQTALHTEHLFKDIRWIYFSEYDSNLYIIDYLKLKKVTSEGEVTVLANNLKETGGSHAGVGDHHYLMGIWMDKQEQVYVAAYGARKVKKINSEGAIEMVYRSPRLWSPCGGLVAPDGSLWIMEFSVRNNTRIKKISPDGKEVIFRS